ncbi:hypothetical protein P8452_34913 [Trifolium repens]|nr:hypothetical protein P8452_34913 [Trifolium repens]
MSMVAKQGWKIMSRPETLVAKIFKARWSVGDGSKIKIMTDPWLRGQGSGWVSAPQHQEEIMAVPLIREVQEDKERLKRECNHQPLQETAIQYSLANRSTFSPPLPSSQYRGIE